MRSFLFVGALVLLSACGGDDGVEEEGLASTYGREEAIDELADALPPVVSVPASDYTTGHIQPPVEFDTSPSIGGDHYNFWQNCGFYTVELIEGAATHTLEHGAIWITYNDSKVSAEDLAMLEEMASANGKLLISPYDHDDTIVLSAWAVQQRGVNAPTTADGIAAIASFIETWQDNPELAEAGVRCNGAVGNPPDDVRSFEDGEQVPPEFG